MLNISKEKRERARQLVSQMTLKEKAKLHAGLGAWHTHGVERLAIPSICLTDGPHGLRKAIIEENGEGKENTVPATCFPPAVSASCSFDRELLYEMGEAMAEECIAEEVAIILGPAANIKRSPLCGRNFEYISEDPYVSGEYAAAIINGIQSKNVGTSLKHFLTNNQETARLSSSSVVDERTLREIYMSAFETAVKKAQPLTVMCSYNRINGTYASNNKRMMTDVLRNEWDFQGLVMTDWGAMAYRPESIQAGIDLEMPGRGEKFESDIIEAVESGKLDEKDLDVCIERLTAAVLQTAENIKTGYDKAAHHALARRIARESAVLLRNENAVLPLKKTAKVLVCGGFAKNPRYQGAGSSLINPSILNTPFDEFTAQNIRFTYAQAVPESGDRTDITLLDEAVKCASADDVDAVIAFVGLPDEYESEGYDRTHMHMPESHNRLIDELSRVGKPLIAVVMAGSAVEIPWREQADAILLMNLGGQNVGGAVYDLIFGDYSPCGKLTETYPLALDETPANATFGDKINVEYRESIFVGYRYYDTANRDVAYPFGHGLSYANFEYGKVVLSSDSITESDTLKVSVPVKNTGKMTAKEAVQLYVKAPVSPIFRAVHELRGFEKTELAPGEEKILEFTLLKRDFAYYNVNISDWHVTDGEYVIEIGASSRDIRQTASVFVKSETDAVIPDYRETAPTYYNLPQAGELHIPHDEFAALFTDKTPLADRQTKPFTALSTLHDLQFGFYGKKLADKVVTDALRRTGKDELPEERYYAPMCSSMFPVRGMTPRKLQGMILYANGHILKGKKLMEDE